MTTTVYRSSTSQGVLKRSAFAKHDRFDKANITLISGSIYWTGICEIYVNVDERNQPKAEVKGLRRDQETSVTLSICKRTCLWIWIGRCGAVEWSAHSPDLSPMDFFLWGYLKDKVYRTKPRDLAHLRNLSPRSSQSSSVRRADKTHRTYHPVIHPVVFAYTLLLDATCYAVISLCSVY
ncbi:hypothetical protein J6590_073086 [Homalodisca vitripennis]|nr:hypothetical protein J6590_073086 [Homalodisca vitripennis]